MCISLMMVYMYISIVIAYYFYYDGLATVHILYVEDSDRETDKLMLCANLATMYSYFSCSDCLYVCKCFNLSNFYLSIYISPILIHHKFSSSGVVPYG